MNPTDAPECPPTAEETAQQAAWEWARYEHLRQAWNAPPLLSRPTETAQ